MKPVNLADAFAGIQELWKPKIVSAVNDTYVKLVKLKGEFIWHQHEAEDELFLVIEGSIRLELRDGSVSLQAGEMAVVPQGVEHRPVAEEEAHVLLIEPRSTRNTGDLRDDRTTEAEWI
ncbi:MAG: cupin domain-containing protein [Thermoplasmata archaeon]